MKKTSSFNKIIHNRSLPPHIVDINGNPLNVEEIRVRFICEKFLKQKSLMVIALIYTQKIKSSVLK